MIFKLSDLLLLLAPISPVLLFGLVGLMPLLWRACLQVGACAKRFLLSPETKNFLLGFVEFLAANLAFTALMILLTGVDLEIRHMPFLQKVKFAVTFMFLYVIAYNLGIMRSNVKTAANHKSTQESEAHE